MSMNWVPIIILYTVITVVLSFKIILKGYRLLTVSLRI